MKLYNFNLNFISNKIQKRNLFIYTLEAQEEEMSKKDSSWVCDEKIETTTMFCETNSFWLVFHCRTTIELFSKILKKISFSSQGVYYCIFIQHLIIAIE